MQQSPPNHYIAEHFMRLKIEQQPEHAQSARQARLLHALGLHEFATGILEYMPGRFALLVSCYGVDVSVLCVVEHFDRVALLQDGFESLARNYEALTDETIELSLRDLIASARLQSIEQTQSPSMPLAMGAQYWLQGLLRERLQGQN